MCLVPINRPGDRLVQRKRGLPIRVLLHRCVGEIACEGCSSLRVNFELQVCVPERGELLSHRGFRNCMVMIGKIPAGWNSGSRSKKLFSQTQARGDSVEHVKAAEGSGTK